MSRTFILLALVLACGCSGSETGKKNNKNKPSDNHLHLLVENNMHDLSKPNKSKFHDSFIEEFDQNRSTFSPTILEEKGPISHGRWDQSHHQNPIQEYWH